MIKAKNIDSSYFYEDSDYSQNIMKMILHGNRLNKNSESYKILDSDLKRYCRTGSVSKMLTSNNVELVYNNPPMPRALKVLTARDLKTQNKSYKTFIDITDITKFTNNDEFVIKELNMLETLLTTAMVHVIYYTDPKLLTSATAKLATEIYTNLFRYVLDSKYKISNSDNKDNVAKYMISKFFLLNVLQKEHNEYSESICKSISGIANRDLEILEFKIRNIDNPYENIFTLIESLKEGLSIKELRLDVFTQGWLFLYGSGSHFALELFTSLCDIIIHTYNGTYLFNQKTIEKIVGQNNVSSLYSQIIMKGGLYIARD